MSVASQECGWGGLHLTIIESFSNLLGLMYRQTQNLDIIMLDSSYEGFSIGDLKNWPLIIFLKYMCTCTHTHAQTHAIHLQTGDYWCRICGFNPVRQ